MGKKKPRSGEIRLTEIELMAFEQIQALSAQMERRLAGEKERFAKSLIRSHGLPERVQLDVEPAAKVLRWKEKSDAETEEESA